MTSLKFFTPGGDRTANNNQPIIFQYNGARLTGNVKIESIRMHNYYDMQRTQPFDPRDTTNPNAYNDSALPSPQRLPYLLTLKFTGWPATNHDSVIVHRTDELGSNFPSVNQLPNVRNSDFTTLLPATSATLTRDVFSQFHGYVSWDLKPNYHFGFMTLPAAWQVQLNMYEFTGDQLDFIPPVEIQLTIF